MKKLKFFLLLLLFLFTLIFTACSGDVSESETSELADNTNRTTSEITSEVIISSSPQSSESPPQSSEKSENNKAENNLENNDIAQKTIDYIINGQAGKSEAERIKWNEDFLYQADIDAVYQEYLSAGGTADDIESFAWYLTENAPIPDNWKELFEADLYEKYDVTVSRYVDLQDGYYQVYVEIDGSEVRYVMVSSRTGYFHG